MAGVLIERRLMTIGETHDLAPEAMDWEHAEWHSDTELRHWGMGRNCSCAVRTCSM